MFFLDKKGLIKVLKEILSQCNEIASPDVMIAFMPPDADDAAAKGEQLHISTNITATTESCLESIIEKYNLQLKVGKDKLVIYESAP